MKFAVLISFALLAVSCECLSLGSTSTVPSLVACPSQVSKGCPVPQGLYPVYIAHPDDCSKFCECGAEGIAWEVQCLPGLYWNEALLVCDWPTSVDCGDRPIPESKVAKE